MSFYWKKPPDGLVDAIPRGDWFLLGTVFVFGKKASREFTNKVLLPPDEPLLIKMLYVKSLTISYCSSLSMTLMGSMGVSAPEPELLLSRLAP